MNFEKRRRMILSRYATIETLKKIETGTSRVLTRDGLMAQSHKTLQHFESKPDAQTHQMMLPSIDNASFTEKDGPMRARSTTSLSNPTANDPIKDQENTKSRKSAQLMTKFEAIEKESNKEPFMIYKKNNLLLEKVILDRALNKIQNRKFIRKNLQGN